MQSLKILFIEPFYGGSHKAFADGFKHYSQHTVQLFTLPPRFWKWRMRGAALEVVRSIPDPRAYDIVYAASMVSLSDLKALWGPVCPPIIAYFHENQLNYPLSPGEKRDFHYGFTDITTGLAAEVVVFNSHYHKDTFFNELPSFIGHMPDVQPAWAIEKLRLKSTVLYPGIELPQDNSTESNHGETFTKQRGGKSPLIVWNHRWEHDKNPVSFFHTLYSLSSQGFDFKLAVAGEQFSRNPKIFNEARRQLDNHIVHFGYIQNRDEYYDLLVHSDIVVSTAYQENFGLSIVEAMAAGCYPLLPKRLSYPELIPEEYHSACLYTSDDGLEKHLKNVLTEISQEDSARHINVDLPHLKEKVKRFSWPELITDYDKLCSRIAGKKG